MVSSRGPNDGVELALGVDGERLHAWIYGLASWRERHGLAGGEANTDMPVFVLTHQAREVIAKEGGTTFTFVTGGSESALQQARAAAGDKDVSVAGRDRLT